MARKKALRYRLFGIGRMPHALTKRTGPSALLSEAGISIKATSRAVRLPGLRSGGSLTLLIGAAVVLPDRVLLSVVNDVIVDADLRATEKTGHTLAFTEKGLVLVLDVGTLVAEGKGTVTLTYRLDLDATTLAGLPSHTLPVAVTDVVALRVKGWA